MILRFWCIFFNFYIYEYSCMHILMWMEYYTCHLLVVLLNDVTLTAAVIISENLKLSIWQENGLWLRALVLHLALSCMSCQVSAFALLYGVNEQYIKYIWKLEPTIHAYFRVVRLCFDTVCILKFKSSFGHNLGWRIMVYICVYLKFDYFLN